MAPRDSLNIYPWDKWFKRGRWSIRRGRDYKCQPFAMAQQIRNEARKRGVYVAVFIDETVLTVTVHTKRRLTRRVRSA